MKKPLLSLAALLLCGQAWGSPAFVQACNNITFSGSTVSCTPSSNPTAGNTFVVFLIGTGNGATNFSVADTCNTGGTSDSYTIYDSPTITQVGNIATGVAVATVGISGSCSVTVTSPSAGTNQMVMHEVSGAGVVDAHNSVAGNFGASASVTATTTVNGDYIFGAVKNTGSASYTAGSGYTIPTNGSPDASTATEYLTPQGLAGSTTVTFNGTANYVNTHILALKPSGGSVTMQKRKHSGWM